MRPSCQTWSCAFVPSTHRRYKKNPELKKAMTNFRLKIK